jgi:CheY-like chemotaxis protein
MDMMMPIKNGEAATMEIRALNRPDATTVPIIAMTANTFDSDIDAALSAGMNEHIAKPIDSEQLIKTIKYYTCKGDINV